ncbi:hypothetical protein GP486_000261 [Trichoglossum hirsutum]|uniref:SGNH hydrolase-type esterase domain-containing protein n=1 Tax=Trichoglossum hirsutum TaxID=265104 RepID=A0A9P8RTQ2_9PEZI|nr:hypothetical protein GP486_000261 [Trichoglossum hirsutum]
MDSAPEPAEDYPKIILFGDSLTERSFDTNNNGFGAVLQNYYARRVDVVNRDAQLPPPLLFTVFLGANDAVLPRFSQHVPLPEYEANLRYYVDTLLAHPMTKGTKIVLITPPPIDIMPLSEGELGGELDIPVVRQQLTSQDLDDPGYRTYLNKKMYAEKVMEIARSYDGSGGLVVGLDFWTAMINYGRAMGKEKGISDDDERLPGSGLPGAVHFGREVFLDGLHLGPLGYDVLSGELLSLLTNMWPELRKESLPLQAGSPN